MYSLVFNETGPKSYTVDSILLLMVSYHLLPQCLMVKSSLKVLIPGIGPQVLTVTSTNSTRRDLRDQSGAEMCYSTGSAWDRYSTTKWSVYPKFHGNLIFPVNCGETRYPFEDKAIWILLQNCSPPKIDGSNMFNFKFQFRFQKQTSHLFVNCYSTAVMSISTYCVVTP